MHRAKEVRLYQEEETESPESTHSQKPQALVQLLTLFNYADEPIGLVLAVTLMMTRVNRT